MNISAPPASAMRTKAPSSAPDSDKLPCRAECDLAISSSSGFCNNLRPIDPTSGALSQSDIPCDEQAHGIQSYPRRSGSGVRSACRRDTYQHSAATGIPISELSTKNNVNPV